MKSMGEKITEIRKSRGLTQDELAGLANINLRTVQRIEKGEVTPRGHTLSSLCRVLEVNLNDLLDYGKVEDKSFFVFFHLSVAAGIIFPLGDIILPLILWLTKRDKIIGLNTQGKNLIIFRIIFDMLLFILLVGSMVIAMNNKDSGFVSDYTFVLGAYLLTYFLGTVIYPVFVAISVQQSAKLKSYYPRIFR